MFTVRELRGKWLETVNASRIYSFLKTSQQEVVVFCARSGLREDSLLGWTPRCEPFMLTHTLRHTFLSQQAVVVFCEGTSFLIG